jgi:acyl-CoA reductase-like NAD-dependent aldehyde dehydrogenase
VLVVLEPATEQVLAELPEGDAESAVGRAKAAFPAWRAVTPEDRAQVLLSIAGALEAHAGQLAELEARNVGKPISSARAEVGMVVHTFRYYAGAPERLMGETIPVAGGVDMTFREPLGVVGLIVPWNSPSRSPAGRSRPRWRPATRWC